MIFKLKLLLFYCVKKIHKNNKIGLTDFYYTYFLFIASNLFLQLRHTYPFDKKVGVCVVCVFGFTLTLHKPTHSQFCESVLE